MDKITAFFAALLQPLPLCALLVLITLYLYYELYKTYWSKRNIPVQPFTKFYNTLFTILFMRRNLGELLKHLYEANKAPYFGLLILNRPTLVVNDAELIKRILVSDFSHFSNHVVPFKASSDPLGTSTLFVTKDQTWKGIRSKLSAFFTSGKLRQMTQLMNDAAADLRSFISKSESQGNRVETKEICSRYATDVIGSCAFGANPRCFHNEDSEFRACAKRLFDWRSFERRFSFNAYFAAPVLAKVFGLKFWEPASSEYLKDFFWDSVKEREKSSFVRHDLIDILMKIKEDEVFMKDETLVAAQAVQFFAAGFETVATTITMTTFEVARNPLIQKQLRKDVIASLNKHGRCTYEAISDMKYVDLCVKESLRKYPIMPFLDRTCTITYKLPNTNATIEKGTSILVPLMGLHYDPRVFPDPERYDPERFRRNDFDPLYYLPFGAGPRLCIGERFGLLGVKIALANIFAEFTVEPKAATPRKIVPDPKAPTITPLEDLHLRFVKAEDPFVFSTDVEA